MIVEVVRIDDRFIHGQVLTKWLKQVDVERIIVVSDAVANDELRKTLVLSVAPANIPASVVSVDKMKRVYDNPKYQNTKVFVLFEGPKDIVTVVEAGVNLQTVNVGGIRFSNDKLQVTKSVSVTDEDIIAFNKLVDLGVDLELRQLPENQSQDFKVLLSKAIAK